MTDEQTKIDLTVNGVEHELEIAPDTKLADVLRHDLGLTGTKIGCSDGQCGSCVVLLDGRAIRSCTYPALRAAGKNLLQLPLHGQERRLDWNDVIADAKGLGQGPGVVQAPLRGELRGKGNAVDMFPAQRGDGNTGGQSRIDTAA